MMHSSRARFMAPYGLKTLLGGLSRAAFSANPNNIPGFAALYFQELVAFREGNPDLDLTELVEEFRFVIEGWNERLPQSLNAQDASVLGEPKQKEKCTDTEEDQLLQSPDTECTSKMTQYPSTHDDVVGNKSPTGPDEASSPKAPELAYVPADPAQLATQMLGNADYIYSVKDVATSVQTLPEVSLSSENIIAVVAGAAEDDAAVPAAEGAAEAARAEAGEPWQPAEAGEVGPSDSQAEVATTNANLVSAAPVREEPSPPPPAPPPAPPPRVPLQALPPPNEAGVTLAAVVVSVRRADELVWDAEVPPCPERSPQETLILSLGQIAYLVKIQLLLNAGQFSRAKILGPSADDVVCDSEKTEPTAQMASAEQGNAMSGMWLALSGAPGARAAASDGNVPLNPLRTCSEPALCPGAAVRAMAASEAGQPPPHSNVWTLYCLTDLSQGQKSPPSLPPPPGTGLAYPQQQFLQPVPLQAPPPQLSSPAYVMPEESKRGNAPPFILVGSTVQSSQDWNPVPGPPALAQPDAGARRFATIPVPVARPAEQQAPKAGAGAVQEVARPPTPLYLSVAIPLDDVVPARKGAPAADKAAAGPAFAGSYGIAGQITVTSSSVHQAGS